MNSRHTTVSAPKKLSKNQIAVLRMACIHGDIWQGCLGSSEYGGRESTLLSLRRRGLLDVMNKPTQAGRDALTVAETMRTLP